jgi:hypothetical protein
LYDIHSRDTQTSVSRVDYAYAEGPRGIQQVRYRKELGSDLAP